MQRVAFTKMVASGNDFILCDLRQTKGSLDVERFARSACDRKFGIGADGVLVVDRARQADVSMRIFNADGSEAEMCGNGARCVAYYASRAGKQKKISIATQAGLIESVIACDQVEIKMTHPQALKLNFSLAVRKQWLTLNFINTGVPHVVVLCEDVDVIDVDALGRLLRFHRRFQPAGTNVNFIEPIASDRIKVRTYERGVEAETLACGTGSVASAIVYAHKLHNAGLLAKKSVRIFAETASEEVLEVNFDLDAHSARNVWLKGRAHIIAKGEYHG